MKEFLAPTNGTGSWDSHLVTNLLQGELEECKKHFNEHLPRYANADLQLAQKRVSMLANHTVESLERFDCGGNEDTPCDKSKEGQGRDD